ncbi:MAG TPA: prepilin peptidase [Candidatus Acidoferrum sp.]|jgi:leader peptidase (prepilin peptidase)/N-methyltransferase
MGHVLRARALRRTLGCGTFNAVIPFFFFLFGICIGSFLNVCISRIPEGVSIVSPGSRCPQCLKPIKPYDNVPILGWLWLRGKCRNCRLPISPMYPIIEFLTGAMFVLTYYTYDVTLATFKFLILGCLLIILIVTDLRVRMLPDAINWPGLGVGLAFSVKVPPSDGIAAALFQRSDLLQPPTAVLGLIDALLGAALGSLLLWSAAYLYKLVRKREGMGMGDVKMMAMVGAFLGVRGAFLTILLGTLLGSIVGLTLVGALYAFGWKKKVAERAYRRGLGEVSALRWTIASQYQLPFGTFLGIAAFLVVYAVPWILPRILG